MQADHYHKRVVTELRLREVSGATRLSVQVKPNARQSRIVAVKGGALEVQVAAPAREGLANAELRQFLAGEFRLPLSRVQLARGERGRHKIVSLVGCGTLEVLEKLGRLLAPR